MLINILKKLLAVFLLCLSPFLNAQEASKVGSLLVTYQTGIKGERLDRIRFRVKNSTMEQQIHPKPGGYVDDGKSHTRIVAIEKLPVGPYTLQFLVPNKDGLFDEISLRDIVIMENTTLKIDQQIRPRYASLKIKIDYDTPLRVEMAPQITLFNHNQEIIASNSGVLEMPFLLPGKYTVTFDKLEGYVTPAPLTLSLNPKEEAGPLIGLYRNIN